MQIIIFSVLTAIAAVFLLSKCFFLAPYRSGWLMLLANLVYEVAERKLRCGRILLDALLLIALTAGSWLLVGPAVAAVMVTVLGLTWVASLHSDASWQLGAQARQYEPLKHRVPLPVPQLIVTIRGPVLDRRYGCYELGDWPEGLEQEFELIVLNPGPVCPQLPLVLEATISSDCISVSGVRTGESSCPEPGEIQSFRFRLKACRRGSGGTAVITVTHGGFQHVRRLVLGTILSSDAVVISTAVIRRWKHGANAAFVWRGDQDLYDPATFQSEEGLRVALGLARRFRMPSSLMLSARLSLDQEEQQAFCDHFGWDRKAGEIPGFARFLCDEVDKTLEQEWPTETKRLFSAEIGNHFYLHYGTHVAADAANGWKSHAGIGGGPYAWLSRYPADSFTEQRDNAMKGSQVLEAVIGVKPASFTIPSDVWDRETARAMEAAGLEVGSETDAAKSAKLLNIPLPHHPAGCQHFVELTRMHPRDPQNACQLAMLKYHVGAARRTGKALVFLAHHHLALYEGNACRNLTEELLRHVLADQEGDVYVATLTAVGRYWRDVLSKRTRCIHITVEQNRIILSNTGTRDLNALPLEITLAGGHRHMRLVSVPAGLSLTVHPN